jgi:hypothetical protein
VIDNPGDRSMWLTWDAPATDGGAPVTSYTITLYIGTTAQTSITSTSTSTTITGLTNGTAYSFTVVANNLNGPSPRSIASKTATPATGSGALGTHTAPVAQIAAPAGAIPMTAYVGPGAPAALAAYSTQTGLTSADASDYLDDTSWATISANSWAINQWSNTGHQMVYGIPMIPSTGGATLAQGATGQLTTTSPPSPTT